jgi:hypothetical protein
MHAACALLVYWYLLEIVYLTSVYIFAAGWSREEGTVERGGCSSELQAEVQVLGSCPWRRPACSYADGGSRRPLQQR